MSNLSNEDIKDQIRILEETYVPGESNAFNLRALRELLAYREAQGKPIAMTEKHEISNMQATGLYLRAWPTDRGRNKVEGYTIPLYAAPQLPVVLDKMTHKQRDILIKTAQVMFDREPTSDYSANIREVARIALASLNPDEPTDDERIMAIEGIIPAVGNVNSPVIPDGWALVPIEPTENMIIEGFESEPNESFSEEKVWEAYQAMSGCNQAAYRARLCWAAMLAAAPKPEVK